MNAVLILIVAASIVVIAWGPITRRLRKPAAKLKESRGEFAALPIIHDREAPIARASENSPAASVATRRRERPHSSGEPTH